MSFETFDGILAPTFILSTILITIASFRFDFKMMRVLLLANCFLAGAGFYINMAIIHNWLEAGFALACGMLSAFMYAGVDYLE